MPDNLYAKNLYLTVCDSENWPSFERPSFLDELDEVANEALSKNSIEGYLASLLIFHQLSEELIRLLLKDAQFFIQLSVFPAEIVFPEKRKLMFGQLIEELKSTISFEDKDKFIEKCMELNKHRIDIVHRLTTRSSLANLEIQLLKVKELYDAIYELFDDIHDSFRLCFKDFKKDIFLDYSIDEFES
ncbi:MAG: hypothetical protein Q8Q40_04170 [Methylococcaceae bacterium]|nr:hypothetical protein [Methylococcaceae bacterium]